MHEKKNRSRKILQTIINALLLMLLIFLIVSPDAKSWVLRSLLAVGFYKGEVLSAPNTITAGDSVDFEVKNEDGNVISMEDLRGKTVFINFWATWCPPCRAEMPSMQALYNKLKEDKNVVMLFINEDEDFEKARAYLRDNQYTMPLLKKRGTIPDKIFSGTLPTTALIDKSGNLVMKHEGIANYDTDEFISHLKALQGK